MPILQTGLATPSASSFSIGQSLRFEPDEHYLSRAYSSAGNRRTWTVSFWHKVDNLASSRQLFGVSTNATVGNPWPGFIVSIDPTGTSGISIEEYNGSSYNLLRQTANLFRDPSAWYHFVFRYDTTQATDSNRIKIYVNGVEVEYNGSPTYPSQNHEGYWNDTNTHRIGKGGSSNGDGAGYFAEFHSIDGQSLGPASFGETNSDTNQWVPKDTTGAITYGTNGFYLKGADTALANSFTDSSKLAIDSSDRESEIAVTSSFTWLFTSSGNTDGEDLVNGLVTNNDAGGGWMPSGSVTGRWIKFDFGSGKVYTKCQWISINSTGSEGTWKWQGSNNDADWTDIGGTFTLGGADGGSNATYTLGDTLSGNTTSYRYYRILGTTGSANTNGRRLAMYFGGWSSGVGKTITANGDVAHSRAQSKIGSSSIKFDGTGDFLSCADSSDWSFGTGDFTLETWVRFNDSAGSENLFSQYQDGSNRWYLSADLTNNSLGFFDAGSGMDVEQTVVTWVADTWYHVAMVRSSGTVTYYVDGTAYTIAGTSPGGNITNNTASLQIGRYNTGDDLNGYLDQIRISDNARYTGAFTPSTTAFTADSNTKLLIHSNWAGGLGADSSGQGNDLTSTNLTANDQVLDAPGANRCTLNPLSLVTNTTLSEGNLRADCTSGNDGASLGTMSVSSGKWYWEVLQTTANSTNDISMGVMELSRKQAPQAVGTDVYPNAYLYGNDGWNAKHNSTTSTINSYGAGDIIGWALDLDGNTLKIYKNNSLEYTYSSGVTGTFTPAVAVDGTSGGAVTHIANFGADSSFCGEKTSQGKGHTGDDFYFDPPSGFKSLKASNLSPPIADPSAHFNTVLYTGNGTAIGSGGLTVSGVGFSSDFTWIKNRGVAKSHNLYNSVVGATIRLESSNADGEATDVNSLSSWNSDGFVLGSRNTVNDSGNTYVSWNWKAGGTASSNSDGSVTSSVSANTTAGMSIVTWTNNNVTVGHGLSQAPELIMMKNREAVASWLVYSKPVGNAHTLFLNTTDQKDAGSGYFNSTSPTASVFSVGTTGGTLTDDFVAYCFHSVEGYSKFGSYVGNDQNPNGPFIYMGFEPALLIIKALDRGDDWIIVDNKRDSYNIVTRKLNPNTGGVEITDHAIVDFVSNGFKVKDNSDKVNLLGSNYLYLAFAESPFKYSNAR